MQIDANYLRDLVQSGVLSPEDVQNELTRLTSSIQPRNDIAPMTPNTMRVENGPDAGKVINLNFTGAPGTPQAPSLSMSELQQQFEQQKPMRVIGAGNGEVVDLGTAPPEQVAIDSSRPQVEIPGVGKADYGKDGNAYIRNPDGSRTKILLGYDRAGSMALNRQQQDMRLKDAEIARTQAATDLTRQSVEQGKVPAGYRATPQGNLEAIPGGPADTKLQGALNQDTQTLQSTWSDLDRLAAAANEVKNHPGLNHITGLWSVLPNVPGGEAANADALLNTLKSQVAFGVLQNMRNNSKTGGALGQVSDKEGQLLQSNLAALDKSQSFADFQKNLQKIIDYTQSAKDRLGAAYNLKYRAAERGTQPVAPAGPTRISNDAEYQALPSGAQFVGPDGKLRRKP